MLLLAVTTSDLLLDRAIRTPEAMVQKVLAKEALRTIQPVADEPLLASELNLSKLDYLHLWL